jgi:hypothetical protein
MSDADPRTMLAQPFSLTASGGWASQIRVTRGVTTYDVEIVTTGTKWFRTYLCSASGGGTSADDPQEFLAYVEAALNAQAVGGWLVSMSADGRASVSNSAAQHAVAWTAAHASGAIVRNLLGYSSDIATTAAGVATRANHHGTHLWTSFARVGDKGWQTTRGRSAYAAMADGSTYGWNDGYTRRMRTFDSGFHPTDAAAQTALDSTVSCVHAAKTRWKQPTLTPVAALTPPWSIEDFLFTAGGYRLGAAFGNFQDLVAGTATEIDVVTLDPKSLEGLAYDLIQTGYSQRRHVKDVRLAWYGTETI